MPGYQQERVRRKDRPDKLFIAAGARPDRPPGRRRGRGHDSLGRQILRDREDRVHLRVRPPENWRRARVTLAIAGATAFAWWAAGLIGYSNFAALWGGFIPVRMMGDVGDEGLASRWEEHTTETQKKMRITYDV